MRAWRALIFFCKNHIPVCLRENRYASWNLPCESSAAGILFLRSRWQNGTVASWFRRHDFRVMSVWSLWRPSGSKCVVFYTALTRAEWQYSQLLKTVHLSLRQRCCECLSTDLCSSSRLSLDVNTRKASMPPPTGSECLLLLLRFHSRWPCVKS